MKVVLSFVNKVFSHINVQIIFQCTDHLSDPPTPEGGMTKENCQ